MNIASAAQLDRDAFLRWNEGREGKRELVNGRIVEMMTGATRAHTRLVGNLFHALTARLHPAKYEVMFLDLGVKTAAGVRYPDVVVDPAGGGGKDLAATAPLLIAEVLSPSSRRTDLKDKATDYAGLPSLCAYLVLSQDEPRVWLWLRVESGWTNPIVVEGRSGMIDVPPLELSLPLSLLYPEQPSS